MLLVVVTSCLWLGALAAWALFFGRMWHLPWKTALLLVYPLWWYAQVLVTRGLGWFSGINQPSLLTATGLLLVLPALGTLLLGSRKVLVCEEASEEAVSPDAAAKAPPAAAPSKLRALRRTYWLESLVLISVTFAGVRAALLCAPRIWDLYTYHLPMTANWLQQGSLAPWPTMCLRQVTRAPNGQIQHLWVVGMPYTDVFVELPSILATAIAIVFVWEVAQRWGASSPVSLSAALSLLAAPQIAWSALGGADHVIAAAGLLCCLYNATASLSQPQKNVAYLQAGAAAISAALVCGTSVPGLLFGTVFGLLFVVFLATMRMWKRLFVVAIVFVAAAPSAFALQYLSNLHRYGWLFPEGDGTDSFSHRAQHWLPASLVYVFRLLFREPIRGIGENHDDSNYGVWFSLVVIPLVLITNWDSIVGIFQRDRAGHPGVRSKERSFVAAFLFVALAATVAVHPLGELDQRFLIWVVPVTLVLAMHALELHLSPAFFRMLSAGFILVTVRSVLAVGYPFAIKSPLFGAIQVWPEVSGYEAMHDALPGDTVLYMGDEDTAVYPCWGRRYSRTVWAADSLVTLRNYFDRSPRWVVLETSAPEDLRIATLEFLSAQGYTKVSEEPPEADELPDKARRTIWRR